MFTSKFRYPTEILIFSVILMFASATNAAVWVVTYPKPFYEGDVSNDYPIALLNLALEKTNVRFTVNPSIVPMRQDKALKRLENNLDINVYWTVTNISREQDLRPIRIPITKGLIGWRMFLAHKNNAFLREPMEDLDDLRAFAPVQGVAWTDTRVLQSNGFNVKSARNYEEAKQMVNQQMADTFPRSVIEVESEIVEQGNSNLRLRDDIVLRYPSAMYFFVNKSNATLANLIQTGLEMAVEDGSLDALFYAYFGDTIERLDVEALRSFEVNNPELPIKTPLTNRALWYMPTK